MNWRKPILQGVLGPVLIFSMVMLVGATAMAAAAVTVTSPAEGETIYGTDVTVRVDVEDMAIVPSTVPLEQAGKQPEANRPGEGHLHFMLDLGPVVVWDRNEPYTFTNVLPGEHQLMVELVNNDHSSLSPPIVKQVRFRSVADQMLPKTGEASGDARSLTVVIGMIIGLTLIACGWILRWRYAGH